MNLDYAGFQALSESQQDRYVLAYGQYVTQRWHENYSVELYALNSFYVERWLEQECREPERLLAHVTRPGLPLPTNYPTPPY